SGAETRRQLDACQYSSSGQQAAAFGCRIRRLRYAPRLHYGPAGLLGLGRERILYLGNLRTALCAEQDISYPCLGRDRGVGGWILHGEITHRIEAPTG